MYQHVVQYYETDKMGITHHSNYIRFMEEARVAFLAEIGWPFEKLEEEGIVSPVISVDCRYMQTTTFMDKINVDVSVEEFKGVKLKLKYVMKNEEGKTVCEAGSEHCFLNRQGMPVRLNREYPLFYQALADLVKEDDKE